MSADASARSRQQGPGRCSIRPQSSFSNGNFGGLEDGGSGCGGKPMRTSDVQHQPGLAQHHLYEGRTKKLKVHCARRQNTQDEQQAGVQCGEDTLLTWPALVVSTRLCSCKGKDGEKEGAVQECTCCKGQGVRIVMHRIGPDMVQQSQ